MTKVSTIPEKETAEIVARRKDVLDAFTSEAGKRVLERLMLDNGIVCSTFVPNDSYASAFMEGRRAVILDILQVMGRAVTPDDFVQRTH